MTIPHISVGLDASPLYVYGAIDTVLETAWNSGADIANDYQAKITSAQTTFLDGASTPVIVEPTDLTAPILTAPDVALPAVITSSALQDKVDAEYATITAMLATKFTEFRTAYFTVDDAAYSAAVGWLSSAMANPNAAVPAAVVSQILEDDKSRILADVARASDAVVATFAARRFPLPPGASLGAVLQIQQKGQDEIAAAGRNIYKLTVDNMKFAVDKASSLRAPTMAAALDYIKTMAATPNAASGIVGSTIDAQSKTISAATQFFGAQVEVEKLKSSIDQFNASKEMTTKEKNQMAELAMVESKLKALLADAQSMAQMATAMFNNVHVSMGASAGYSESTSRKGADVV